MSNDMDANISFFTIDDVGRCKEFDVIANVEVGEDLNEVINRHEVRAGIVNLALWSSRSRSEAVTCDDGVLRRQAMIVDVSLRLLSGQTRQNLRPAGNLSVKIKLLCR